MKRSEFLKRLGLGLGAAAIPSLLKGEEKWAHEIDEPEVCYDDSLGKPEKLIFWRSNDNAFVSSAFPTFIDQDKIDNKPMTLKHKQSFTAEFTYIPDE